VIRVHGAPLAGGFRVQRWTRVSIVSALLSIALVAVLALVPFLFGADVTEQLTTLLIFVILAVMWNALAGYGGLISVGQQAFIGLGAYGTIYLTQHGFTPYVAMIVAGLGAGAVAVHYGEPLDKDRGPRARPQGSRSRASVVQMSQGGLLLRQGGGSHGRAVIGEKDLVQRTEIENAAHR